VVKLSIIKDFYQRKNRLFLFVILVLSCVQSLHAAPIASIDRSVIAKDDTLGFTIRSYKTNSSAPDLSPLENNFYVIANNQSSRFVNRNGQSESWTEWQISLIPKRIGQLTIPPIRVNGETTQALYVNVQPSIPVSAGEIKPVYIESEIDRESVYVQQQFIYTLRIFQSIQLENMNISEPEFDNAAMEKMEQNSFQRRIMNTPYRVHELRYAIFPQETGELIIPEMVFTANQVETKRSAFSLPGQGKTIRKISKQHTITVKAPPTDYGKELWLPAESLKLVETWSQSLDDVHVGDSITRSITLNAQGLLKSQLPPFQMPKLPFANTYPDQGQSETTTSIQGASSSRTDNIAIIPTRAGTLTLPEIRIKWWDTKENTMEETIIAEHSILIKPAIENTQGNSQPLAVDHSQTGSAIANPDAADKDEHSLYWQLSTLFFAVAWIITLLIWRTRAPSKVKKEVPRNDVAPLNTTEKNAFKTLEKACHNNDIADIRVGIISWAKCYWPDKNIKTLQDIDRLCGLMQLKEGLRELDKLLYGNASDSPWNSENLLRSLKQLRDNDKQTLAKKEKNLKPLYQS
jgi:hypothetical protein